MSSTTALNNTPASSVGAVNIGAALGRVLISAIFILSGISKLAAPAATIGYIEAVGLPFPQLAFAAAVVIEIAGGIALVVGFKTRWTAAILALFSVATALSFHVNFGDQNQFIHFFKNIAMAGGLLQIVAFGGGALSLDAWRK
jgi:putative oxidoreductase